MLHLIHESTDSKVSVTHAPTEAQNEPRWKCQFREQCHEHWTTDCTMPTRNQAIRYCRRIYSSLPDIAEARVIEPDGTKLWSINYVKGEECLICLRTPCECEPEPHIFTQPQNDPYQHCPYCKSGRLTRPEHYTYRFRKCVSCGVVYIPSAFLAPASAQPPKRIRWLS